MASLSDRVDAYHDRFCFVDETCCIQRADGSYIRAYADPQTKQRPLPVTEEAITKHLRGEITLAFYSAKRVGRDAVRVRA